jgi:hypothetical protein
MAHHAGFGVLLLLAFLGVCPVVAAEEPVLDASGLPAPAWQIDPQLAEKWRALTGKYIYQAACTTCHAWGPDHLDRNAWQSYLAEFPDVHEPDVRKEYADLTAQFTPGRMVPNLDQRTDALATFLLSDRDPEQSDQEPWDGFPQVGDPAPDFEIVDLAGRRHNLADYRGKSKLVLVFSRAHW